ncbi:MAG: tetratricopeptide repeat protein [Moraxella sp.]|uniref:tetratricopeptide repeat protein n=1 Tax=Moraxella sp. TaxID=479 RepID=UPI0026DAA425|nr:tetratricopeptide repeat protein [Moraxella sp.]MDO4450434.1 tetratricopeptide repeat protein [Moraxella sp.]
MMKSYVLTFGLLALFTLLSAHATEVASVNDNAQAQFELALAHLDKNTYEDNHQAIELLHQSATQGHMGAQYYLGSHYDQKFESTQAIEWYSKSALQGHASSQYNLGLIYMGRHGISENLVESAKWFTLSAKQDHAKAQNNLAILYEFGKGVPQDIALAKHWYTKACEQNHPLACENLQLLQQDNP